MSLLPFINHLCSQRFQAGEQRLHRPPAHLLRSIQMPDALLQTQKRRQETGGRSCASNVNGCFLFGDPPAKPPHADFLRRFIRGDGKAQIGNALHQIAGIIGKQCPFQDAVPVGKHGEQKRTVCDAFGTGHPYRKRFFLSRLFVNTFINIPHLVDLFCHGICPLFPVCLIQSSFSRAGTAFLNFTQDHGTILFDMRQHPMSLSEAHAAGTVIAIRSAPQQEMGPVHSNRSEEEHDQGHF